MESRPRADIYINLPALRKLDSMLMVIYILSDNIIYIYIIMNHVQDLVD